LIPWKIKKLQEVAVLKKIFVLCLVVLLAAPFMSVSADTGVVKMLGMRVGREYGHPIYVWNEDKSFLMDVLYKPSVGYDYVEIEAAFYAFVTQVCGGEGEPVCWHGRHVGLLKNTAVTPPIVAGFYHNEWDGKYYLIDTGQCLLKDGCLDE
jgi:hypothetical protein